MQAKLHFQGLIEVSMYTGSYTQSNCTSSQSHRGERRFSCSFRNSSTIHIFSLYLVYLAAKQISLFTVQCNLVPTKTTSCIKTHPALEISAVFMGNHKRNTSPFTLQSIEINTKLRGKDMKCTV